MANLNIENLKNIANIDFATFLALKAVGQDTAKTYYLALELAAESAGLVNVQNYAKLSQSVIQGSTISGDLANNYTAGYAETLNVDFSEGSEDRSRMQFELMKADILARESEIIDRGGTGELDYERTIQIHTNALSTIGLPPEAFTFYTPLTTLSKHDPNKAQQLFLDVISGNNGFLDSIGDGLLLGFGAPIDNNQKLSLFLTDASEQMQWAYFALETLQNTAIAHAGDQDIAKLVNILDGFQVVVGLSAMSAGGFAIWTEYLENFEFNTPAWLPGVKAAVTLASSYTCPLVLDLGQVGITLSTLGGTGSVYWDIDNDGFREASAWVGPEDGLLAIDKNGDGTINTHSELFGSNNQGGFSVLSTYDSNGDGQITSGDAQYSDLLVWVDANSDGYSQSEELHTLTSLGISNISLSVTGTNYSISGNPITATSTFTMYGQTKQIVDANFAFDNVNTVYSQDYTLDVRTLFLPTLRGYGKMADLHISMSQNAELLDMVQEIATKDMSEILGANFDITASFTNIFYEWAGVTDYNPDGRGGQMTDDRKLEFLEQFLDLEYYQAGRSGTTVAPGALKLDETFHDLSNVLMSRFLFQTDLGKLMGQAKFDVFSDEVDNFSGLDLAILEDIEDIATGSTEPLHVWQQVLLMIEFTVGTGNLSSGDLIALQSALSSSGVNFTVGDIVDTFVFAGIPVILEGTSSDDSLTGAAINNHIFGLEGNDVLTGGIGTDQLDGGSGNDYLAGGLGDDALFGGTGNDTYFYQSGQDNIDEVNNTGSNLDKIVFREGISISDLTISRDGYDLNIIIAGGGSIRIFDQFEKNSSVELLVFHDNSTFDLTQLEVPIEGTVGDDVLTGSDESAFPHDIIHGYDGDDTLIGGQGDDYLYGGQGDDDYVVGIGRDTVEDSGGANDRIVFDSTIVKSGISFQIVNNLHLNVLFNGSVVLKIMNQFYSSNSFVETLVFSDSSTIDLSSALYSRSGTDSDDIIYGLTNGVGFNDKLDGGHGNDLLAGGDGDDVLNGGDGYDTLNGSDGNDIIDGGADDDILNGESGDDTLTGGTGNDRLSGGAGNDRFIFSGNWGMDMIYGYSNDGTDTIHIGGGLTAADIRISSDQYGYYYIHDLTNAQNMITIGGHVYANAGADSPHVEVIEFDDNSTISLTSSLILQGGADEDRIYDTNLDGTIYGHGGADYLYGYGGNDILHGGDGNDNIYAGQGDDTLNGDAGDDLLVGDAGNDTINGGDGYDNLHGEDGDDILNGGADDDYLGGGNGADILTGGTGNDNLNGGAGNDRFIFSGDWGMDTISGYTDDGIDTIRLGNGLTAAGIRISSDQYGNYYIHDLSNALNVITINGYYNSYSGLEASRVELIEFDDSTTLNLTGALVLEGDSGDDRIYDTNLDGTIYGHGGADYLYGYGGNDILHGGDGNDNIYAGQGDDTLNGDAGDDLLVSDAGNDILNGGDGYDNLHGEDGDDVLSGGADDDYLGGGNGDDILTGGAGNDSLNGGSGNDRFIFSGTWGMDTISGYTDDGIDTISLGNGLTAADIRISIDQYGHYYIHDLTNSQNLITITGYYNYYNGIEASNVELIEFDDNSTLSLTGSLTLEGGESDDRIYDTSLDGTIYGYGGADYLYGHGGNDILHGGDGNDYLYAGQGNDILNGDAGDDVLVGDVGNDTINGGDGYDNLHGEDGDDILNGGADSDYLSGGNGADILTGGAGNDNLNGGAGNDRFIFSGTWEMDTISGYTDDGIDTLRLGNGLTAADIRISIDQYGHYYIHDLTNSQNLITINGYYSYYNGVEASNVELIEFDDTTILSLNGPLVLEGGESTDRIYDTNLDGTVYGYGGLDYLHGHGGNDILNGGTGDDYLYGGLGSDTLNGDEGYDNLSGDDGDDILSGGADDDYLNGGNGADTLTGGTGNDNLNGGAGNDRFIFSGAWGADIINGYADDGIDTIYLGNGLTAADIRISIDQYGHYYIHDLTNSQNLITINGYYNYYSGIEASNVELIEFDDNTTLSLTGSLTLKGGSGDDRIYDTNLDGIIYGHAGADYLYGHGGNDTLHGGDGNDYVYAGQGNDTINGDAGDDLLIGESGDDVINGGDGYDNLHGGDGDDVLNGEADDDYLSGGNGADILAGGAGNDNLDGGLGNDRFIFSGTWGMDTISGYTDDGIDTIHLGNSLTAADIRISIDQYGHYYIHDLTNAQNLITINGYYNSYNGGVETSRVEIIEFDDNTTLSLAGSLVLNGSSGVDRIYDTNLDGTIYGHAGADYLYGHGGNDVIHGGDDNDYVYAGQGDDILNGDAGEDILIGEAGDDIINGGDGYDNLHGGDGDDVLNGGADDDYLGGGNGADILTGGAGNDNLYGDSGGDIFLFDLDSVGGLDTIGDFNSAEGDKLDISQILFGYDELTSAIDDFITFSTVSGNTIVSVDRDGVDTSYSAQAIATLSNVTGLDADTMLANNNLIA